MLVKGFTPRGVVSVKLSRVMFQRVHDSWFRRDTMYCRGRGGGRRGRGRGKHCDEGDRYEEQLRYLWGRRLT